MSSKPEIAPNPANQVAMRLPGIGVLALSGRDAGAFAQAQFSGDVMALADLQWQWSAWLNPKGRVIALFQLLRLDAEHYWAVLPDMPAEAFAERLRRFVFRSKVTLSVPDAAVIGVVEDVLAQGTQAARDATGRVELAVSRAPARALRVEAGAEYPEATPEFLSAWRLADIAQGLPRLTGSAVEAYTPQMLGLDRLKAYSLKKGCYPGQEIVSRTHYLGQAKRGLQRVRLSGTADVGERLLSDAGGTAEVVCSACADDVCEALLVAALEPPVERWRDADGNDRATPLPLSDAIVR